MKSIDHKIPGMLLALSALITLSGTALAEAPALHSPAQSEEAGPEDGKLCCNGAEPLLFNGREALGITGRAGIFKSNDEGGRWMRSMQGLVAANGTAPYVNAGCQSPTDRRVVYVLAGLGAVQSPFNGVFASEDFGTTWKRRGVADTGFGSNLCEVDALDPKTLYIDGFDSTTFVNTIWKSTDGGRTQQVIGADLPPCAAGGLVFSRPGALYVAGQCVFVSLDGGASFQPLPLPPVRATGVSPDGAIILVATDAGTLRSTDRGVSFAPLAGLPYGFDVLSLAFDPSNSARIYASDGLLHLSTDGGASFNLLPASQDPRFQNQFSDLSVSPHGSLFFVTLGGIARSDDAGRSFHKVDQGLRASAVQDLAINAEGRLLVGVYHTKTAFEQTRGLDYKAVGDAPAIVADGATNNGVALGASPLDPNVLLLATDLQGAFRTDTGGQHWESIPLPFGAGLSSRTRIVFATGSRVYLAVPNAPTVPGAGLYRSDDAGRTFAQLASLPFGAVAVDPTNADVVYLGTTASVEGLFKSTDGGRSMQSLGQPGAFSTLLVDRRNPQLIYAGLRSGQLIRSRDGGMSFTPASKGLRGAGIHGLVQDVAGTLYVWIREGGLYASDDQGRNWHAADTDEALSRSGVETGRGSLVADPQHAGRLYLGNAGVLEVNVHSP